MSEASARAVADLARRVAALEATVASGGSGTAGALSTPASGAAGHGGGDDGDPLWAVHALQRRATPERPGAVVLAGVVPLPGGGTALWQEDRAPRDLVDGDPEGPAERLRALGSPVRLRILREVLAGRTGSGELAADPAFGTSGQVNHHLRQLVAAGWLRPTARGHHAVPTERVVPLLAALAAAGS